MKTAPPPPPPPDPADVLSHLGAGEAVRAEAARLAPPARIGRVIEQHRAGLQVDDGEDPRLLQAHPTLQRELEAASDGLVVGDWVVVAPDGHGGEWIERLLPRGSVIVRGREENRPQRVVANADTALLVMGLDGDYSPNRMERYLMLVRAAGIEPLLVLTKADRSPEPEARADAIRALVGADTTVTVLDPRAPTAAETLAPWLGAGRTLVMLGSSGVGKSSLMNTLLGESAQRTGATRERDDKGRHTTTTRTLRRLPQGACLIDTPGVRELKLTGDETVKTDAFEDVQALAEGCRFADCRHDAEPGCAVVAHVSAQRLENFRKLQDELTAAGRAVREARRAGRTPSSVPRPAGRAPRNRGRRD